MIEDGTFSEPCVITEEEVIRCLRPEVLIRCLEQAFRRQRETKISAPLRRQMDLPDGGIFLTMPCCESSLPLFGVKLVSIGSGAARVQADYVLYDCVTRRNVAMIAANYLTDIRTASVSAIATKSLARKESKVLGIFGTGRQALSHTSVFTQTMPFTTVLCCGTGQEKSKKFADGLRENLGIDAHPCNPEECLSHSDVICCCTTSSTPLFRGSLVRPGTHLNLVGTFRKNAREVDGETVRRARLCVETYEGVLSEGGDILMALSEGLISDQDIVADLHELLVGKKAVRRNEDEITIFKSVGYGYEDLIAALVIYDSVTGRERKGSRLA